MVIIIYSFSIFNYIILNVFISYPHNLFNILYYLILTIKFYLLIFKFINFNYQSVIITIQLIEYLFINFIQYFT